MKIFILQSIGPNIFIDKNSLEHFKVYSGLNINYVSIGCISGFFGETNNKQFEINLPILNGFTGKNFFHNAINLNLKDKYILGKNIFDFEYNENLIKKSSEKIIQIKKELESNNLITNSKKEEFKNNILDGIYNIGGFLIKLYFLIDEIITNKNDLQNIINNPSGIQEYKSQAKLLDQISLNKLDLLKVRYDTLNLELQNFSDVLSKYGKIIIKK